MLNQHQQWVKDFNEKQGWGPENQSPFQDITHITEEVGELARAVRRIEVGRDAHTENEDMTKEDMMEELKKEAGDVLRDLLSICNRYGFTIEEAFSSHQKDMVKKYGDIK